MDKKTLIFDFDGTIADTIPAILVTVNKLSSEFGFQKITKEQITQLRRMNRFDMIKKIVDLGIPVFKIPQIVKRGQEELGKNIRSLKPIEGIRGTIVELKNKGFNLGVLSSNSKENVEEFLKQNKLIDFFDFIESENNLFGKARALSSILKKHSIDKNSAYYIGDETRDIEAAADAGIKSAAVCWGFNAREILEKQKADFIIDKPRQLIDLFL